MQSGNLGIQATEKATNTKTNQQNTAIMGEAERGERPKHNTQNTTSHTEKARRGARRQQRTEGERTHTHQKGHESALAESKKGPRIIL